MITIKQDAEFMKNLVAANPVPAGRRFVAIKDENAVPAVLSLSEDNKLDLIMTVNGTPALHNLGSLLGVTGKIQAFDAKQGSDRKVWIAIASENADGKSNLHLAINMMPSQLVSPPASQILQGDTPFPQVYGIYMSDFTKATNGMEVPFVFLGFQPLDRITEERQLGFVDVTHVEGQVAKLVLNRDWKLATNPSQILDVTFLKSGMGIGAAVLYSVQGGSRKIQYRTFVDGDYAVEPICPKDATCVASYVDPSTTDSVLLVGGEKISCFKPKQYLNPKGQGLEIVTPDSALKELHTAQNGAQLTLWYTTSADGASYYETTTATLIGGDSVRLLPDGQGGRISGILSAHLGNESLLVNTLVSVDNKGKLSVLQQASDTGMWEVHPFYTPSKVDNMEVPSFTLRIKALNDATTQNQSKQTPKLFLNSSGATPVTINGEATTLTYDGAWYSTDANGILYMVISTADMACHTLQVKKYMSSLGDETELNVQVLNPSKKTNEKLMEFDSSPNPDLLEAKTQNGKPLIEPGTVSKEEAGHAGEMLKTLNQTQIKMALEERTVTKTARCHSFLSLPRNAKLVHIAGKLPSDPAALARITTLGDSSSPWDFFYWLWAKAKEVATWVLQKIDGFYHLVLDWAGKAFRFVLDTIAAVGKAISWVFEKIKVGIEKIIEFIGFLFSWGDILDTSDSIRTLMTVGLDYGQDQISKVEESAKAWISQLKQDALGKKQPKNISTSSNTKDPKEKPDLDETQHGVAYNWSADQMHHGGFTKSSQIKSPNSYGVLLTAAEGDPLTGIWDDFMNEVEKANETVQQIAEGIKSLFTPSTDTNEVFAKLKDTLIDFALTTLGNAIDILLKSLRLIMKKFKELGTYVIEAPIFTALWKLISNGRECTLFNCFSLIVAVPVTVLFKVISGVAPPKLEARLTTKTFAQYLNGEALEDTSLSTDIAIICGITGVTTAFLAMGLTVLTMLIDTVAPSLSQTTQDPKAIPPPFVSVPQSVGNVIDLVTMFFDIAGLWASWPLKYEHDQDLHWWVWGLDCSNAAVLAISRMVGWYTDTPRVETKRVVGVYEAVTSIPTYILQMIISVHELQLPDGDPEKDDALVTRHIVEDTAGLIGAWAFGVAALTDDVQDEVCFIALAVMVVALTIKSSFKFVDFIDWYSKKSDKMLPEMRHMPLLLVMDESTHEKSTQYKLSNGITNGYGHQVVNGTWATEKK